MIAISVCIASAVFCLLILLDSVRLRRRAKTLQKQYSSRHPPPPPRDPDIIKMEQTLPGYGIQLAQGGVCISVVDMERLLAIVRKAQEIRDYLHLSKDPEGKIHLDGLILVLDAWIREQDNG